jgi:hypothetical protein
MTDNHPKAILTNLLTTWDDLSDEAILMALLTVARHIEAQHKAVEEPPPTLGINVVEVIKAEDRPA